MPINPIPQPVDVVINPSGESPKVKDFIINAPLIVQSTNVKDKLDILDTTSENLLQRVATLETRPIGNGGGGQTGDYVPTSRTINNHALTCDITITKSDIQLSNVDNTSDINKPVSTLQAAADAAVLVAANAYTDSHSGGGGLHGSGTLASLPISPSAGDTYVVTSGEKIGDYYQCFISGTWELVGYDHAPLAPYCVARWKLEDSNSSTIIDPLGAYNLSFAGSLTTQNQSSPWKTCMVFNDSTSVNSTIIGASTLEPADITILVWACRYGSSSYDSYIVLKRQASTWGGSSPNNAAIAIRVTTSNTLSAYIFDTSLSIKNTETPAYLAVPVGKWFRVACTHSVSTGLKLYLDGRLVSSAAAAFPINYQDHNSWGIGANIPGTGVALPQGFNGFIRDVQVCNQVLTAGQILEDYECGLGIKRFTISST